ncbi:aminotransferase class I/II-fold pyridoxal phosphate-dependent enzyme [Candidatus Bathyarchaeota archaeon]|nr:aminotransferase class I/II-fold pyridoxal phosphate-dependent enzyme [Candidatus Bathyarchaeota archaeon]MBS7630006.1 aminotransferase class I/II-fold pyridoxal phosphate-dependent enzyme [Candidatus Bathyarchaeota archaeon]
MRVNINLEAGDPDAEAPEKAKKAVIEAINLGGEWTHYSHLGRTKPKDAFLEAVVEYYERFGPKYKPEQVLPTAGSGAALYIAMATISDKGDEIIVFDPTFVGYFSKLKTMGVKPIYARLAKEKGFHIDYDSLKNCVGERTKAILLCNPNNPTGTVFTKDELKAVRELALDHDLYVIADEIYLHFVYDDNVFTSIASLDGMLERTINVMSFSKTFSMTGWRLGYAIVPEKLLPRSREYLSLFSSNPSSFILAAGVSALKEGWEYVEDRRREYQKRRDFFCKSVDDINGLHCEPFEGAFYAWIDISETGLGSEQFVEELNKSEGVQLSPGIRFGPSSDEFVRASLVKPISILEEVVRRLERFVGSIMEKGMVR